MKIEVKERFNEQYYNEVLYVMTNYEKFIKNPKKKVYGMTRSAIMYAISSVIMLFIMLIFYFIDQSMSFVYLSIFFAVLSVLSFLLYFVIKFRIKKLINAEGTVVFNIDNKGISTNLDGTLNSVKWDNLKYIIINNNSINFIPTNRKYSLISMNIKYKDEILEEVKKLNKDNLVIENL